MHPAMIEWLRHARRVSRGCSVSYGGCGVGEVLHGHGGPHERGGSHDRRGVWASGGDGDVGGDDVGGGAFGVRRPLRFLAHKLELDDRQVGELAAILSELKTERAQAAVDHRRSTAAFADAMALDAFDDTRVTHIASERVRTAERLRDAVVRALARIHALLTPDQRGKLAYLVRTGALTL
jgi:Spy/CpxP family protein refolding chaperone